MSPTKIDFSDEQPSNIERILLTLSVLKFPRLRFSSDEQPLNIDSRLYLADVDPVYVDVSSLKTKRDFNELHPENISATSRDLDKVTLKCETSSDVSDEQSLNIADMLVTFDMSIEVRLLSVFNFLQP